MNMKLSDDCMALITAKLPPHEMNREQYYQALIELHNKYPMPGHNPPLTSYQIKNWKTLKERVRDPNYDIEYEDHLFPMNFLEAAEMYKASMDKRDDSSIPLEAWKKRIWPSKTSREEKERPRYADDLEEAPF